MKNEAVSLDTASFLFGISFGIAGFAKEVVCTGVVESSRLNEDLGGDVVFSGFVFGAACLRHAQHFCNLGLMLNT